MVRYGTQSRNWEGLSPWSELYGMGEKLNQLSEDKNFLTANKFPSINVWEGNDDLVLTAELPGVCKEDIDISIQDNLLILRGNRKISHSEGERTYYMQERLAGNFSRSFRLPYKVDRDKIEAKLKNGILHLTLPRSEEDKPKKIEIKTSN